MANNDDVLVSSIYHGLSLQCCRAKGQLVRFVAEQEKMKNWLTLVLRSPWIDCVRSATHGRLILGFRFLRSDLVR